MRVCQYSPGSGREVVQRKDPSHAPAADFIPVTRILPRSRDVSRVTSAVRDHAAASIHDIRAQA